MGMVGPEAAFIIATALAIGPLDVLPALIAEHVLKKDQSGLPSCEAGGAPNMLRLAPPVPRRELIS